MQTRESGNEQRKSALQRTHLPFLDVVPEVFELVEAQFSCAVALQGVGSKLKLKNKSAKQLLTPLGRRL